MISKPHCVDCDKVLSNYRKTTSRCKKCKSIYYEEIKLNDYIVDENGCWIYKNALDTDGYGRFRKVRAFKYVWEKSNGKLLDGYVLDHTCDNRLCINMEHLRVVSFLENARRKITNKLSFAVLNKIKNLYKLGITQSEIAKRFNVNQCHISRIINNKRWCV